MRFITGSFCTLLLAFYALVYAVSVSAEKPENDVGRPIWAKNATALDLTCQPHSRAIRSPDRLSSVIVTCELKAGEPTYRLRVITADHHEHELPMTEGSNELLWAPDSRAFFVNGGLGASSGFFVDVFQIDAAERVMKRTITRPAQMDMVKSFPPCKAWNGDEQDCLRTARHPEYNMSALAWTEDSSAIYVIGEVPCSSWYGGIMCQVLGYELAISDGHVVKRLSARQAKQQWGSFAAWDIRIPDPPKYGPAHVTW